MQRKGYDVGGIIKWAKDNWQDLAKVGGAAAKSYIDYQDQKRRNEVEQAAYNEYLKQVEAAGQEAQAAVDLNLMPMAVTNVPTTKADVSSFTAVAARGGLMNLPTRQRKRYASQGFVDDDIEVIEPESESLGDFELKQEEGVNIGPMAAFPDTGNPIANAQQVWESGQIDQGIYQMDFNMFFQSGDWMDYIGKGEVQGDTQMASDPSWESEWEDIYNDYKIKQIAAGQEFISKEEFIDMQRDQGATGGIIGLRHGGRPGYAFGPGPVEEVVTDSMTEIEGQMASDKYDPNDPMYKGINKKIVIEFIQEGIPLGYSSPQEYFEDFYGDIHMKKGGRVKRDNGGIMNLGGLEKDYRTTGGFVPIGEYEKKMMSQRDYLKTNL